jgi:hypothetical protein
MTWKRNQNINCIRILKEAVLVYLDLIARYVSAVTGEINEKLISNGPKSSQDSSGHLTNKI